MWLAADRYGVYICGATTKKKKMTSVTLDGDVVICTRNDQYLTVQLGVHPHPRNLQATHHYQ